MNYDQLYQWIAVTLIRGIGPNLAKNLIAYLGNEQAVFKEKLRIYRKFPAFPSIMLYRVKL